MASTVGHAEILIGPEINNVLLKRFEAGMKAHMSRIEKTSRPEIAPKLEAASFIAKMKALTSQEWEQKINADLDILDYHRQLRAATARVEEQKVNATLNQPEYRTKLRTLTGTPATQRVNANLANAAAYRTRLAAATRPATQTINIDIDRNRLAAVGRAGAGTFMNSFGDSLNSGMGRVMTKGLFMTPTIILAVVHFAVAVAAVFLPALGAALVAAGGLALVFAGALTAVAVSPGLQSAIKDLGNKIVQDLNSAVWSSGLGSAVQRAINDFKQVWDDIRPSVERTFAAMVPMIDALSGAFGDFLRRMAPIIEKFAVAAQPFIQVLADWMATELPDAVGQFLDSLTSIDPASLGHLLTGLSDLLIALGKLIELFDKLGMTDMIPAATGALVDFLDVANSLPAPVIRAILALTNPFMALIEILRALAFTIKFVRENWSSWMEWLGGAWSVTWQAVWGAMQAFWNWITTVLAPVFDFLKPIWTAVWNALTTAWNTTWEGFKVAWNAFYAFIEPAWTLFREFTNLIWGGIKNVITSLWNSIWTGLRVAWDFFNTGITEAWNLFKEGVRLIWTSISFIITTIWNHIWSALRSAWNGFSTVITGLWNIFRLVASTIWNAISAVIRAIWNAIWPVLKTAWDAFFSVIQNAWNNFRAIASSIWNSISATISAIWRGLWSVLTTLWSGFSTAMQAAWNGFRAVAGAIWGAISSVITTIWAGIWTACVAAFRVFATVMAGAFRAFATVITTVWNGIRRVVTTVWNATWNAVVRIWRTASSTLRSGFTSFRNVVSSVWSAITSTIQRAWNAIRGIFNSIKSGIDSLLAKFRAIPGVIRSAFAGLAGIISGPFIAGFNAISRGISKLKGELSSIASAVPTINLPGFATGGLIQGAGGPTDDAILARLSAGEYVLRAEAVDKLGVPFLDYVNAAKFAEGGIVGMAEGGVAPQATGPTGGSGTEMLPEGVRFVVVVSAKAAFEEARIQIQELKELIASVPNLDITISLDEATINSLVAVLSGGGVGAEGNILSSLIAVAQESLVELSTAFSAIIDSLLEHLDRLILGFSNVELAWRTTIDMMNVDGLRMVNTIAININNFLLHLNRLIFGFNNTTFQWLTSITSMIANALRLVNQITVSVNNILLQLQRFIANARVTSGNWLQVINQIITAANNLVNAIGDAVSNISRHLENFRNNAEETASQLNSIFSQLSDDLSRIWDDMFTELNNRWDQFVSDFINALNSFVSDLTTTTTALSADLNRIWSEMWTQIQNRTDEAAAELLAKVNELATGLLNRLNQLTTATQNWSNGFVSIFEGIPGRLLPHMNKAVSLLKQLVQKIGNIPGAKEEVKGVADKLTPLQLAEGGRVNGPGGPTGDKIPAMLSRGEYVMPAHSVHHYGPSFMDAVRRKKLPPPAFAEGGPVMLQEGGALDDAPSPGFPSSPGAVRGNTGVWRGIVQLARSWGEPARLTSGYRAGDPLWHGSGLAADLGGFNQDSLAGRFLAIQPHVLELIHRTNRGDYGVSRGRRWSGGSNSGVLNAHRDHIHIAMTKRSVEHFLGAPIPGAIDPGGGALTKTWRRRAEAAWAPLKGDYEKALKAMDDVWFGPPVGKFLGKVPEWLFSYLDDKDPGVAGPDAQGVRGPPPDGAIPAFFTYFGSNPARGFTDPNDFGLTASGVPPSTVGFSSPFWPLGTEATMHIGGKNMRLKQIDFGPALFVVNRHPGQAVIDLTWTAMQQMLGRVGNFKGYVKVEKFGSGRTYPGNFRERGYDSGGWLEPGRTMTVNNTGKPEAIFTSRQTSALLSLAADGGKGGQPVRIEADFYLDGEKIDAKIETKQNEHDQRVVEVLTRKRKR